MPKRLIITHKPKKVNHSRDVLMWPPTENIFLEDLHNVHVATKPHCWQWAGVQPEDLAIALSKQDGLDSEIVTNISSKFQKPSCCQKRLTVQIKIHNKIWHSGFPVVVQSLKRVAMYFVLMTN